MSAGRSSDFVQAYHSDVFVRPSPLANSLASSKGRISLRRITRRPASSQSRLPSHSSGYASLGLAGMLLGRSSDFAHSRHSAWFFSPSLQTYSRASSKGRQSTPLRTLGRPVPSQSPQPRHSLL